MSEHYKKTLEAAELELAQLMTEKARIDTRVARLRETIMALTRLVSGDEDQESGDTVQLAESGLTESIREVLQEFRKSEPTRYHLPTKIRDRLRVKGFSFAGYKNEMAAVHNVLKRLRDLGEIEVGVDSSRKAYYRWIAPVQTVVVPETARVRVEAVPPEVRIRPKKPLPEWYKKITENGKKPLDFSKLTRGQKREAAELGIDDTSTVNPLVNDESGTREVIK